MIGDKVQLKNEVVIQMKKKVWLKNEMIIEIVEEWNGCWNEWRQISVEVGNGDSNQKKRNLVKNEVVIQIIEEEGNLNDWRKSLVIGISDISIQKACLLEEGDGGDNDWRKFLLNK